MKLTSIPHLDGDPGVTQTIRQMRRLIQLGKKDPTVHELAARILRRANAPAYDWQAEARAIFEAVQRNLRFTRDVNGHETLHAAPDIIRLGIADCDDFTILICSLMETIGADTRIVTIATHPDGEFCHVYPEAEINGRWVAMDAARQFPAFGKSPEQYTRKRVWDVSSEGFADVAGIRQNIAPGEGPQGAWTARVYPPFRLAARAMTGTYLREFPVAPPHQQFHRPPLGHGNYGVPAARRALGDFSRGDLRRTLGQDDGFDWSSLAPIISAGTTGAANIISAERASPYNLFPTTSTAAGGAGARPLIPAQAYSSISAVPSWAWIGGALLLGAVVLEGRR
jgi:Transglutaminase-like superfamily